MPPDLFGSWEVCLLGDWVALFSSRSSLITSSGGQRSWPSISYLWVSPTLSKPDTGKGRFQTAKFIGTRASGHPSWPGVADSTQGRIHWRRPSAILRFSLASLRRTIHTGNLTLSGSRQRFQADSVSELDLWRGMLNHKSNPIRLQTLQISYRSPRRKA